MKTKHIMSVLIFLCSTVYVESINTAVSTSTFEEVLADKMLVTKLYGQRCLSCY
jgi:hypothetical protein